MAKYGDMETSLRHISIDSRTMKGDDLFVPLIGEKADAHRFLSQAFENGAAASLTSEHDICPEGITGALIRVEDTKRPFRTLAAISEAAFPCLWSESPEAWARRRRGR